MPAARPWPVVPSKVMRSHAKLGAVMAFVFLALSACAAKNGAIISRHNQIQSPSPSPTTLTLHPILVLKGAGSSSPFAPWHPNGTHCRGGYGRGDLHIGTAVTLYAQNGDIAGTGFVMRSKIISNQCALIADVKNAAPRPFYDVQFANRNKIAFSRQEIEKGTAQTYIDATG